MPKKDGRRDMVEDEALTTANELETGGVMDFLHELEEYWSKYDTICSWPRFAARCKAVAPVAGCFLRYSPPL